MSAQSVARRILVDGDHRAFRRHWGDLFPHLEGEGPKTDTEAEIALHYARTVTQSIPQNLRAWSHRWLSERELPSGLPDEMRPKAERLEPKIASAVGISVQGKSETGKLAAPLIRRAMENAVLEAAADHRLEDTAFVKARMQDARTKKVRELFGKIGGKL